MDAEQKYTEVDEFEIDDDLFYKMKEWGFLKYAIPAEVFYNIDKIPYKNGMTQSFAGVAHDDNNSEPTYFECKVLRQDNDIALLFDVTILTDPDDYLDYILKNKSLSHTR
mgnify:CR=1 FL=1